MLLRPFEIITGFLYLDTCFKSSEFETSADPRTGSHNDDIIITLGGASDAASGLVTGSAGDDIKIISADAPNCTAGAATGVISGSVVVVGPEYERGRVA